MLKEQAARTPAPQWVRVIGGWTEFQFAERRMPTLDEINAVAPDTPVFVMHLYDRALLNAAALRAVGYEMLKAYVGTRTSGLLFHTSSGAQMLQTNVLRDSLHPTLKKLEHIKGGFNIFRRYRITLLGKSDCPDALRHFWSGHAAEHVSERYEKLLDEREYRLEWAERIGLGFKIPGSVGLLGLLRVVPNAA
jgi:predicted amidohydrolase YtcJ